VAGAAAATVCPDSDDQSGGEMTGSQPVRRAPGGWGARCGAGPEGAGVCTTTCRRAAPSARPT